MHCIKSFPGFDERLGALSLELFGQLAGVNATAGETVQHGLAVPAIDGYALGAAHDRQTPAG